MYAQNADVSFVKRFRNFRGSGIPRSFETQIGFAGMPARTRRFNYIENIAIIEYRSCSDIKCKIPSLLSRQSDLSRRCVRTYAVTCAQLACRSRFPTDTDVLKGSPQTGESAGKDCGRIRCFAHTMYSAPVTSRPL